MSVVNNCDSQSFVEINLLGTPLGIGYSSNYKSASSGAVMERFFRCMHGMGEEERRRESLREEDDNSLKMIENEKEIGQAMKKKEQLKKCTVTIDPNSTLIIPLALTVNDAKIGVNTINLDKGIALLSDFGEIVCPKCIKFNCNKTLLHITPYKQI
jgi:hypothetical protein